MRRFNVPPGWPAPPNVRWRPPRGWVPDETWPEPPPGWPFWVDQDGRQVSGPLGRYGGPRRAVPVLVVAAAVLLGLVIIWALPSGDDDADPVAGATRSPTPTGGRSTGPSVEPSPSVPVSPSARVTPTPNPRPTAEPTPRPSVRPSTPSVTPKPTATATSVSTPKPTPVAAVVYKNCAEVRAAGAMPLRRGEPGYTLALDRDGDGLACNRGSH